jgi:broad specificity phosphatase PhoE
MIIYLVRHGEYQQKPGSNHQEAAFFSLSDFGKEQAKAVAKTLQKLHISKIISSTMERTQQTAHIISQVVGIPVSYDARLVEHAVSLSQRDKWIIKELRQKVRDDHSFVPPDGESFARATGRFIAVLDEVATAGLDNLCIISHREVIQNVLMQFFNLTEPPPIHECSITTIEYNQGIPRLVFANRPPQSSRILVERVRRIFKRLFKKLL